MQMPESADHSGAHGVGAEHGRPDRSLPTDDPIDALADLESQAAAWSREELRAEVDDRAAEAYRSVVLAGRLVASLGAVLTVEPVGTERVRGLLVGAGDGWLVIDDGTEVVVLTDAVTAVRGAVAGAASAAAWPLASRRSVAAVLQRQAGDAGPVAVSTVDGRRRRGRLGRVGADFVELVDDAGQVDLLPLAAVATVRPS